MRHGVRGLALAALGGLMAACSSGGNAVSIKPDRRIDEVRASRRARTVHYALAVGSATVHVDIDVQDDYRYAAKVGVGSDPVYEEVDYDDQRLVRVVNPGVLPASVRDNPSMAPLVNGAWVADTLGAPSEFSTVAVATARSAGVTALGPALVLSRLRELDDLVGRDRQRVRSARIYDPKSSTYRKHEDKFPAYPADGQRYDVIPAAYNPAAIFHDGVPGDLENALDPYFLSFSVWFRNGRITWVERLFEPDTVAVTRDMRTALDRQARRAGIPKTAEVVPPLPTRYHETYTFDYPATPVVVSVPAATATVTLSG